MQAAVGDPAVLLVDARAPERFEGKSEPLDRTPGHIPGAVNHFYKRNVTDEGVMLPPDTLRRQFAEVLGGRRPDQVVMYCGSGVSACHNLLAMEHAGMTGAKLYPGSWSEWSSDPQRPVETGPARRSRQGHQEAVLIGRGVLPVLADAGVGNPHEDRRVILGLGVDADRDIGSGVFDLPRRLCVGVRDHEDVAVRELVRLVAPEAARGKKRRVRQSR